MPRGGRLRALPWKDNFSPTTNRPIEAAKFRAIAMYADTWYPDFSFLKCSDEIPTPPKYTSIVRKTSSQKHAKKMAVLRRYPAIRLQKADIKTAKMAQNSARRRRSTSVLCVFLS